MIVIESQRDEPVFAGETRTIWWTYRRVDTGVYGDPTLVSVRAVAPDSVITTYTFGVEADIVKDSVGHYHIEFAFPTAGLWVLMLKGSGGITDVKRYAVEVSPLP